MPETNGERIVNNVYLVLIARIAMIVAASSLPIAGWMLQRSVSAVDLLSAKIDTVRDLALETGANVKLIQQSQQLQTSVVQDHENRIRILEGAGGGRRLK